MDFLLCVARSLFLYVFFFNVQAIYVKLRIKTDKETMNVRGMILHLDCKVELKCICMRRLFAI